MKVCGEELMCQQGRQIIKNAKRSFLEYALKIDKSRGNKRTSLVAQGMNLLAMQGTWV